jgi:hypothetical protein
VDGGKNFPPAQFRRVLVNRRGGTVILRRAMTQHHQCGLGEIFTVHPARLAQRTATGKPDWGSNPKTGDRNPKEARNPKHEWVIHSPAMSDFSYSDFGIRISFGIRHSGFSPPFSSEVNRVTRSWHFHLKPFDTPVVLRSNCPRNHLNL